MGYKSKALFGLAFGMLPPAAVWSGTKNWEEKTVFLYAGPDQIIPIASALSTIFGVAMIFWGKLMNIFRKIIGASVPTTTETQDKPQS